MGAAGNGRATRQRGVQEIVQARGVVIHTNNLTNLRTYKLTNLRTYELTLRVRASQFGLPSHISVFKKPASKRKFNIEIYADGELVATHPRDHAKGKYTIVEEHLASNSSEYRGLSAGKYIERARKVNGYPRFGWVDILRFQQTPSALS